MLRKVIRYARRVQPVHADAVFRAVPGPPDEIADELFDARAHRVCLDLELAWFIASRGGGQGDVRCVGVFGGEVQV